MPSQEFSEWWQHHMAASGNAYGTRIAWVAIKRFWLEVGAAATAIELTGTPSDAARVRAMNKVIRGLKISKAKERRKHCE